MSEAEAPQGPSLNMERVYVRDVSFESPNAPMVFLSQEVPEIKIELNIGHRKLESDDYYEVVLNVNANAKAGDQAVFLVELQQAGLFMIKDVPESEMEKVLEIACPNILLPFAREAINDYVGKGGFPQLLINPVNFEALYMQKQAAQQQAAAKH
jgi:preprotein translocase subunit SecB